jgi:hypothetical protein
LRVLFFLIVFFNTCAIIAQTYTIRGQVTDSTANAVEMAQIAIKEDPRKVSFTNTDGQFTLQLNAYNTPLTLVVTNLNYHACTLHVLPKDSVKQFKITLKFKNQLNEVIVTDNASRGSDILIIQPKLFKVLPSTTGNFEDLLKTQIGVSANNELSSGYSVRGGNFDENLVYVNDFEIFRPQLARSGQQEGLSFINPLMVQQLRFSPGGFEAQYGDKFSSVLDVRYTTPLTRRTQISTGLTGAQFQSEGLSKSHALSWNIGARYRSLQYLFNSLEMQGAYRPRAWDIQGFFKYRLNSHYSIESLLYTSKNTFQVVPTVQETNFGTVKEALRLRVYFDGQELLQNQSQFAGIAIQHAVHSNLQLKYLAYAYTSLETERTTLQGQYWIDQLETDLSKPNYGQVAFNRGVGTFLQHARNTLSVSVMQLEHKGQFESLAHQRLKWGIKLQNEIIQDRLKEWRMTDSAGFIQPYNPNEIQLQEVLSTSHALFNQRAQTYIQYEHDFKQKDSSLWTCIGGIRHQFWSYTKQHLWSPRLRIQYVPNWTSNWVFSASGGIYYQAPFYRELRNLTGELNPQVKAQKSIQYYINADYQFNLWNRPFRLIQALYYKTFTQLNPYEIDNIRIRYFANNNTTGYAAGYDIRLNGNLVPGAESWINLGFLQTQEYSKDNRHYIYKNAAGETIVKGYTFDQIKTDSSFIDPGWIPRPTDQLLHLGFFFQDYLPKYPQFKFNMTMQFGTGLPFGPPQHQRWTQVLRMPPYRRVDVGFAYNAITSNHKLFGRYKTAGLSELTLFVELFNILQISNIASYTWIQDITGNRYAVPNYLSNRTLNLRMFAVF